MPDEQQPESADDAPAEPPAQAEPVQAEPEPVEVQLDKARAEAQRLLANWQRAEADFANYKRRVEQERDEARRLANASLIINILPVLDDLERALASLNIQLSGLTWFDGIRLIHRKLQLVLESAGVSPIQAEGQLFDPRFHEAVMYGEGEDGKVVAEVQRGYLLHDRVLRPAMVIVGKGKEEKAEKQGTGNKEHGGEPKEDQPS